MLYGKDDFIVNDELKFISIPHGFMNKYNIGQLPIKLFHLHALKGYTIQLNIF